MHGLSNRTSNDPRNYGCWSWTLDRSYSRFVLTEFDRSVEMDDRGATVELQPLERLRRGVAAGVVRAKSKITTMTRSIDYSAPRTDTRTVPAYRGMLFPRSDTKYITARRTTWTDRTLELETWVIKVPKDNWLVSKEIRDRGTYWEKCRCIDQNSK